MGAVATSPAVGTGPARLVVRLSAGLLSVERLAIMGLMALLTTLILVNVATRYAGRPIYWIDESAVYAVVWLTFIGGSAMTRLRLDFAVTMLTERLSPRAARIAKVAATSLAILFGVGLAAMCWLWLDPLGIARAGFDARDYAGSTFNFVYTERTQTLNWPSWIVYLILPLFAVSMTVHGLANLVEDLGLVPPAPPRGFALATVDGVN
jgi:TRAP-type C4-dicarboxylate transport system permease small subunit